jgi:hypothetical protein
MKYRQLKARETENVLPVANDSSIVGEPRVANCKPSQGNPVRKRKSKEIRQNKSSLSGDRVVIGKRTWICVVVTHPFGHLVAVELVPLPFVPRLVFALVIASPQRPTFGR